jgi:alkylhydroperoxidase family enzyme
MARINLVFKPSDYPGTPDDATREALEELFGYMYPGQANPEIPGKSAGFAIVTQNPQLALLLVKLSAFVLGEMPFTSKRKELREFAVQTLNWHFKCDFSFQAHMPHSVHEGMSLEQQALLPFWRTANVFNEEQRLIIEYTLAVVVGDVPEELFSRVKNRYGEKEAVELTFAIGWWSLWAMLINATGTDFDFGYVKR